MFRMQTTPKSVNLSHDSSCLKQAGSNLELHIKTLLKMLKTDFYSYIISFQYLEYIAMLNSSD